ncbi:MAG: hypothetical protein WCI09_09720 [Planctomycetota bacterium]
MDSTLPESWRVFFWDYDFASLRQEANRECVIGRMRLLQRCSGFTWLANAGDVADWACVQATIAGWVRAVAS